MDADERWLLAEMLRESERVADRIFRMAEEQDDKTEQGIALGVATLGGGLALATVTTDLQAFDLIGALGLTAASALNLLAIHRLLDAYVGWSEGISLTGGPDPAWIAEKSTAIWDTRAHLLAVLAAHGPSTARNLHALRALASRRKAALRILMLAVGLYAFGAFYIVAGTVVS